ncbi:MAG TPA: cation diffusion facilitator family transporter [Burkholderiaceae bacterium]|nr:cation diffusion facilitator family transporter [Burkholderiaceae bacterium]
MHDPAPTAQTGTGDRGSLTRFAWLSIAAAVATISIKTGAWWLTGSVGLLSDALESIVNLVAAAMTLWMLALSARPPTEEHAYGYSKAEYFASGLEGALIFAAALAIAWTAIDRLLHPQPLERIGLGLALSVGASAINFGVARVLLGAARRYRSIALEADAHHLMTDVWTSVGVVVAVGAVAWSGWNWLDPVIALAVAANIVLTGFWLVRRSALGLLDRSIPEDQRGAVEAVLQQHRANGVEFHALRTRAAAGRSFISIHVLVPGAWTVQRAHDLAETIEREIAAAVSGASVFTHIEPREDPTSYADIALDRTH